MKRRALLGTLISLPITGCLADLPGPTGPQHPPKEPKGNPRETSEKPPVSITDFGFESTDAGTLKATVTVTNNTNTDRSVTITGKVIIAKKTYTQTAQTTAPASGSAGVALTYGQVSFEKFNKNGQFYPTVS